MPVLLARSTAPDRLLANGIDVAGAATIGSAGTGALTLLSASTAVIGGNLQAGVSAGANASIYLNTSNLTVGGNAYIGQAGTANLSAGTASYLAVGGTTAGIIFVGSHGAVNVNGAAGLLANAVIMSGGAQLNLASGSGAFYLNGASDPAIAAVPVELVANGVATLNNVHVGPPATRRHGRADRRGRRRHGHAGHQRQYAAVRGLYTEVGVKAGDHGTLLVSNKAPLLPTSAPPAWADCWWASLGAAPPPSISRW